MKMKRSKKLIVACMLIAILIASLSGCGSSSDTKKEEQAASNDKEETESADDIDEVEETEDKKEPETNDTNDKIDLENYNQVLIDQDGVKFEIKGIDPDNMWGYTLNAYLENNTDKSLMYTIDYASVNGLMSDPFWAETVAPGKKSNGSISWSNSDLDEAGIEDVTELNFRIRIHDSEDYMADDVINDYFSVYPLGESAASNYERKSQDDDVVLFDTDDCKLTVIGYEEDGFMGYEVKVFIENKSDKNLMFAVDEASVNGFMADPFWATTVGAGKKSFSEITWLDSTLEENNIEKVESIDMNLHVYPDEDWSGDYLVNDTFTIEPK